MKRHVSFVLVPVVCVLPIIWLWGPGSGSDTLTEAEIPPTTRDVAFISETVPISQGSSTVVATERQLSSPTKAVEAKTDREPRGSFPIAHPSSEVWSPLLRLEQRFSKVGRYPTEGSRPFVHVSDALIGEIGDNVIQKRWPFNRRPGQYFRAHWSSEKEWGIAGHGVLALPAFKHCLDGQWLHISGDSTGEQLFNSMVVTLDPAHHHKLVTRYDDCVPKYHLRRMALLKEHPKNKTAIWENQLWLCHCRQHSLWWEQTFSRSKDGFDFRITYSYKELMFEKADVGLLEGVWPRHRVSGEVTGNLFEAWNGRKPDVWIANSGAHTFHIPNADIDDPPLSAFAAHARNISRFAALVQTKYLDSDSAHCFLWKGNNVPPTHRCPSQFFALNFVTVPAMLAAGFHVIDPEELSSKNPGRVGKPCDIHQAPQDKIPLLALSAVCHACHHH